MHGQLNQYFDQYRKTRTHHQVHRYAQNPKQLLLRLRILQRRHFGGSFKKIKSPLIKKGPPHIQTIARCLPGP